jgi:hypothetical protein
MAPNMAPSQPDYLDNQLSAEYNAQHHYRSSPSPHRLHQQHNQHLWNRLVNSDSNGFRSKSVGY